VIKFVTVIVVELFPKVALKVNLDLFVPAPGTAVGAAFNRLVVAAVGPFTA